MSREREKGLEFEVGRHRVVVPAALVTRVVEVDLTAPPPLARDWLGGVGVSEGDIFLAVDLGVSAPPGRSTCVILESARPRPVRWALRVSRSVGFVEVTPCARPKDLPAEWPSWVKGAERGDVGVVGLLDVVEMGFDYERG